MIQVVTLQMATIVMNSPKASLQYMLRGIQSCDGGNIITRNLEQQIIPQPSVPHRTTQERGHTTERPSSVANSHQNHFLTVGDQATKNLKVLTLPALTFYNHTSNLYLWFIYYICKWWKRQHKHNRFHLPKGALLAQSQCNDIGVLLNWLKLKLSVIVNLCMVTFINFR